MFIKNIFSSFAVIFGIYCVIDVIRFLFKLKILCIHNLIIYLGKISLGIYAIHYYFLNILASFPVLGPLVASVILFNVVKRIPGMALIAFGEPNYAKNISNF